MRQRIETPGRRAIQGRLPALLLTISLLAVVAGCGDGVVDDVSIGGEEPEIAEETPAPPSEAPDPAEGTASEPADPEVPPADSPPPSPGQVHVFLVELDTGGGERAGAEATFGCGDRLRAVEVPLVTDGLDTSRRIAAAVGELLERDPAAGLYTALGDSTLTVDRVEPVAGVEGLFRLHLTGVLSLGGVCDNPRVRAQLERTALQFEGVEEVEILVDGRSLDALLTGRG